MNKEQEQLVVRHIGFAERLAQALGRRVMCDLSELCIDMDDLKQESLLGLCEAALRYDQQRGVSFRTLAYYYCRRNVLLAIRKYGVPVSVPDNRTEPIPIVRLSLLPSDCGDDEPLDGQGAGANPTADPFADLAADPLADPAADPAADPLAGPVAAPPASLRLGDLTCGIDPDQPEEQADRLELLDVLLASLAPRERQVLRLTFGLDGEPLSYANTGRKLGMSGCGVSQLVKRTMAGLARRTETGAVGRTRGRSVVRTVAG